MLKYFLIMVGLLIVSDYVFSQAPLPQCPPKGCGSGGK